MSKDFETLMIEKTQLQKFLREEMEKAKNLPLHPILDHYNIEINKKLGKKLFKP